MSVLVFLLSIVMYPVGVYVGLITTDFVERKKREQKVKRAILFNKKQNKETCLHCLNGISFEEMESRLELIELNGNSGISKCIYCRTDYAVEVNNVEKHFAVI